MGKCFSCVANIIFYAQKLSYCIALVAVTSCLLLTLVVTLGVGIGMGYHYAVVEHTTHELLLLAKENGSWSQPASNDTTTGKNFFYYRRKAPLTGVNLTEEEVPIQRYRTYRRRRHNDLKLNSSHLFSRLPQLFKVTTIRTIHNLSTTLMKTSSTTITIETKIEKNKKKMTKFFNSTTLTENIRLKKMTQYLGKKYANKDVLGKKTKFNGTSHYYGNTKDKIRTTDQKQKQQYFLKSLIQIYQNLMSNSSSSTHL